MVGNTMWRRSTSFKSHTSHHATRIRGKEEGAFGRAQGPNCRSREMPLMEGRGSDWTEYYPNCCQAGFFRQRILFRR